jgi:hypothetical protein
MPHWVELTFPKPVEAVRVELVNRAGPYQITDFEIELFEGNQWKPIKKVQGASGREIAAALAPPQRTNKLRVKILRELFRNEDRQYADVAAIRVLDAKGRNWVGGPAAPLPLAFADPEIKQMFAGPPPAWPPMAVRVEPTRAKVVANVPAKTPAAAILSHRFGAGEAQLITTSDGAFDPNHSFWIGLARWAAGEPTLVVSSEDARQYRVIMTRAAGAHVLHVIDSQTGSPNAAPRRVQVSLPPARLGGFRNAIQVGAGEPLRLSKEGERTSFTVQPDPVASVILK